MKSHQLNGWSNLYKYLYLEKLDDKRKKYVLIENILGSLACGVLGIGFIIQNYK